MANAFYGQSGGVTAVINATAAGVIDTTRRFPQVIERVYAGRDGILGALYENLVDTSTEAADLTSALQYTPGGAFGSCRYKLQSQDDYQRILKVFEAHDIRYFFYNGGGDSQDTTHKLSLAAGSAGYELTCIGIPKTIDNDLPGTDTCPGFGSVAKYVATSAREIAFDMASMHSTSTKVYVMEVMGRHAGWIAAAAGLACDDRGLGPDMILIPEIDFDPDRFLDAVQATVAEKGFCLVVASEGIRDAEGRFLSESSSVDAFGHAQLGGLAPKLVELVKNRFGYKCHWSLCDYLQRSARHLASATDLAQAYALGEAAVNYAVDGRDGVMPGIVRTRSEPYVWHIEPVPLSSVAGQEHLLPRSHMNQSGFQLSAEGRRYFAPLIVGEAPPPYQAGLPAYRRCRNQTVTRKLPAYTPGH